MSEKQLKIRLTGTKYPAKDGTSRQDNVEKCIEGEPLELRHTPILQDKNAVRVFRQNGEELGWIPREHAKYLSALLDNGSKVDAIFESQYRSYVNAPLTAEILIATPDVPISGYIKTCGNCQSDVEDAATTCPNCGKKICKNCGNPIGAGVTKCPKCGEATTLGGIRSLGCLLTVIGMAAVIGVILLTCAIL